MSSAFNKGASFTSLTLIVKSVESVRPPASVAVTVTEYVLESSLAPPSGVSKLGADLNVSSPILLISNREASSPVSDQLNVSPASASVTE